MTKKPVFLPFITLFFLACQPAPEEFVLVDKVRAATIYLPENTSAPVKMAVNDLISDVRKITGRELEITEKADNSMSQLMLFNLADPGQFEEAMALNPALDTLRGKWEAYVVQDIGSGRQKNLLIAGSDERATIFGIYHFIEEYLGVDPTYYWSGLEPAKQRRLAWNQVTITQNEPSFKFRGWFINDEDLLTEWVKGGGIRQIDYPYYGQVVAPEVIERVFESLIRLRFNLVIPASFVDIRNPAEERLVALASQRGLFVSMHHVEPMGVSAFAYRNYWKEKGEEPLFSFYSEPEKIIHTWQEYAKRWAKYPNVIWQVGLRGIADRPMWMADPGVPQSDAERGAIISEAIQTQWKIIDTLDQRDNPPMTTTLWAEGAGLNQEGHLSFPDSLFIIFSDNSPGWKWQRDFYETNRNPANRYGVYYHHQLWGSGPHLAQAAPVEKTYEMFKKAMDHGASDYAIMNVSNVREFVLGVEASAAMLYDLPAFDPAGFLQSWFRDHFGEAGEDVQRVYESFFDSYQIHEKTTSPFLLDGQTRSFGLRLLNRLKVQLNEPERYRRILATEAKKTMEQTWGSRYLSDMHPAKDTPPDALLPHLQEQIKLLENVMPGITAAEERLTGDTLHFFQANLKAQHHILLGLNRWLEAVIQGGEAINAGDREAGKAYLEKAIGHLDEVGQGKAIASQGEKWEYWYRGDRKMNIAHVRGLTEHVLTSLPGQYP